MEGKNFTSLSGTVFAGMTDISDEDILTASSGEVTNWDPEDEDTCDHSLLDETIFSDDYQSLGHIPLHEPVVNIQYMYGRKPRILAALGLDRHSLERVVYQAGYIVTDPGTSGLSYKQVLSEKEYNEAASTCGDTFTAMIGPAAIETLLAKEDVPGREYMILHNIPVLPKAFRRTPFYAPSDKQREGSIDHMYRHTMYIAGRLQKVARLGAPEIIIRNERRQLQESVDALVSNGLRGRAVMDYFGIPCDSMDDIYRMAMYLPKRERILTDTHLDGVELTGAGDAYWTFSDGPEWYEDKGEVDVENTEPVFEDVPEGFEEKKEQLNDTLRLTAKDFLMAYMKANYPGQESRHEQAFWYATSNLANTVYVFIRRVKRNFLPEDKLLLCIERGLMDAADIYMEKHVPWTTPAKAGGEGEGEGASSHVEKEEQKEVQA